MTYQSKIRRKKPYEIALVTDGPPLHVLLALIGRHALDLIGLLGLSSKLILRDLAKTNFLVCHIHKSKGNDRGDQKWRPPTGVSPEVSECLAGREKNIDQALPFRQGRWFLRKLRWLR